MKILTRKSRKQRILQVVDLSIILIVFAIIVTFSSCKPQEILVTKTEYRERLKFDSIYMQKYDSIYIEKRKDTVWVEKYRTVFKDRLKIEKDTINITDTLTIVSLPTVKEVPVKVYDFFWGLGLTMFIVSILYFVVFLIKNFINIKIFK